MAVDPKFSRLKPLLMTTGLQQKDNRLFQFLDSLVSALVQGQTATNTAISSSSSDISGKPFLTHDVATGIPNYRRLMPGDNISFDDTIANERTVDSSGLVVRDSIDLVTGNIASGATESGELDLTSLGNWETLQLLKLTSDRAGYLVLYASAAERTADIRTLPATTDPIAGEGVLIDAAFGVTDKLINITPPVLLYNDETPLVDTLYYRFYNAEGTAGVTTISISYVVTISGGAGPSSFPAHNLLSSTHPDTTPASGVAGDIVTNQAGAWARLPIGSNGRVLGAVAGNPAWSLDGTSLALDASNLGIGVIPLTVQAAITRLGTITGQQLIVNKGILDDVLRLITSRNVSGASLVRLDHNRGPANVTNSDQASLFDTFSDSDTTVNAIITSVRHATIDKTDGSQKSGLTFWTQDGTNSLLERMRLSGSVLDLLYGQIKFPATQNPSSDANTLDDYEEGTWTPTLGGSGGQSGQVYSGQSGAYVKVGQLVHISFRLAFSTLGTVTGTAPIQGLPFTSINATNYRAQVPVTWANLNTAMFLVQGIIISNVSVLDVNAISAAVTSVPGMVQADLLDNSVLAGTGCYISAA